MIILIAESKTMRDCDMCVSMETYASHRPLKQELADKVMNRLTRLPISEISSGLKCSMRQAAKLVTLAYEFPNKTLGMPAIEAFTGVVFRAFDYPSLTENEKTDSNNRIRIISSLYGWLRPEDIVKNYRLEFNAPLAPDGRRFYDYWRKDNTIALVRELEKNNSSTVLNLMPNDAAKTIDWKLVKAFAKVYKVDFKELIDGGSFKTPKPHTLKALRGELLRAIIAQNITDPKSLLTLSTDNLSPLGTPDYPDHISFCC